MNKLDLPNWSGETYDLYSWLTECETMFASAETGPIVRIHTMKHAMPEKKRKPFHSVTDWDAFKDLLMLEYGSLPEFA